MSSFDPDLPYRCAPSVSLRPEPFGALAYDFSTRRLSFLKSPELVKTVRALISCADVHGALEHAGVPTEERRAYLTALAGLAEAGTIQPRR
ncbi:mycofactocin biosynthesis chaperone MftB [Kitasatospora sp. CMC57]|uniref:Mycofactocin biosynthesis chaperone MftB n=1 Tax=Kitasatospora sp. CMC57 TaxID=3231513 RepID=A0AB33K170_9ACTN